MSRRRLSLWDELVLCFDVLGAGIGAFRGGGLVRSGVSISFESVSSSSVWSRLTVTTVVDNFAISPSVEDALEMTLASSLCFFG